MPELPEVETICRGIRPHIVGRTIKTISHSGKALRSPVPLAAMQALLLDKEIVKVHRRAKYLIVETEDNNLLIIHLGMTGNLGIFSADTPTAKHCHLQFLLSDGMELRYADVRRLGSIHVILATEAAKLDTTFFRTTGPEPFSEKFTATYLHKAALKRSVPVKTFIMTNKIVAGVGNIYANESLFRAGIDPRRKVSNIPIQGWHKLVLSIREVLEKAIECGGSTISNYVNANHEAGYFQINFQVYGKTGKVCRRCSGTIEKQQIGGRASFFCPSCQS